MADIKMVRKKVIKKEVVSDPRYQSKTVAKFINHLMRRGKKETARSIVYAAFEEIEEKTGKEPIAVFKKAIRNVRPNMEVRSQRVGGANYQVPYRVPRERGATLAMRWIIESGRRQSGTPMGKRLANELMQAAKNEGSAVRKRDNTERMARANKAFAYLAR